MDNISKINVNGTTYGIVDTVTTVNGKSGAIAASDIATVLSAAGYKLTDENTVTSINGKTGAIVASDIASVLMAAGYELTDLVNRSEMGAAGGVATLDNTGKVPSSQLPSIPDSFQWYGVSTTAAKTVLKEVTIPSITNLVLGQLIIVKPTITSTVANSTLKLNNFDAYPMLYTSSAITTSTDSVVWGANTPSMFLFDGSYWIYVGRGCELTYSAMSSAEGITGTKTTARVITAAVLKAIIDDRGYITQQDISGKVDNTTTINGHTLDNNITVTKSDIGLGNITNDALVKRSEMGLANGVATLDTNGYIPYTLIFNASTTTCQDIVDELV